MRKVFTLFESLLPGASLHPVGRAISDHEMIHEGDRILVGLSGGKDSLSLLHLLLHFRWCAPVHFEVDALTVDPMVRGFEPACFKPCLTGLGVPYFFEARLIMEQAKKHTLKPLMDSRFYSQSEESVTDTWLTTSGKTPAAIPGTGL
ncbi:MAG: hypothetical protein GXP18_03085 [Gammaproteobacteria bacterium]|nr:hypothetical protein [Gammaproteobacteria bacterium]